MKKTAFFSMLAIVFVAFSCTSTNKEQSTKTAEVAETPEDPKDVTQLTWREVVGLVYDDEGQGVEWHGEEMPNELTEFLAISSGDPCGDGDCGKNLSLTSSAEKSMIVIIKGDYDIEGDQGYIPRRYTIEPGQTLNIGCSHLCYGGKSYEFPRTIVGSEYAKEGA